LAATFAGLAAATKGRCVRRDETRGDNESPASEAGGKSDDEAAADGGGTAGEPAGDWSNVTGDSTGVLGSGAETAGSDAGNGCSAGADSDSGPDAGGETGGEAGAAFRFNTDRRVPEPGASSEASIVAGAGRAVNATGG
jgi:hypothetical protein